MGHKCTFLYLGPLLALLPEAFPHLQPIYYNIFTRGEILFCLLVKIKQNHIFRIYCVFDIIYYCGVLRLSIVASIVVQRWLFIFGFIIFFVCYFIFIYFLMYFGIIKLIYKLFASKFFEFIIICSVHFSPMFV